jgi:hypothetical protein
MFGSSRRQTRFTEVDVTLGKSVLYMAPLDCGSVPAQTNTSCTASSTLRTQHNQDGPLPVLAMNWQWLWTHQVEIKVLPVPKAPSRLTAGLKAGRFHCGQA